MQQISSFLYNITMPSPDNRFVHGSIVKRCLTFDNVLKFLHNVP